MRPGEKELDVAAREAKKDAIGEAGSHLPDVVPKAFEAEAGGAGGPVEEPGEPRHGAFYPRLPVRREGSDRAVERGLELVGHK